MSEALGQRIVLARQRAGLSQEALGERIGANRFVVIRLEKGERDVSAFELAQIADVLGTTVRRLLGREGPAPVMAVAHRVDLAALPNNVRSVQTRARRLFELEGLLDSVGVSRPPRIDVPAIPIPAAGTPSTQGQRLAEAVRQHLKLPDGPLSELPDLVERRLGIDVALEPMPGDVAGLCVLIGGSALAMANSSVPKGRQRFTVAHEVCHVLCSDSEEVRVECDLDNVTKPEEVRANAFARHFLVPASALRRELSKLAADAEIISVMYAYGVSLQALLIQMREGGLITQDRATELQTIGPGRLSYLLGFRSDWTHAYKECVGIRRPPSRLETRCFEAYTSGLIGIGPVADLLGEPDAEALRDQLAREGVTSPAYESDAALLV